MNKKSRESTPRQTARLSATDEKITAAVLALARREGLGAVSIDAVAAESGVAKTTIYRRYDDRSQMLDAVARELAAPPEQDYPMTQSGLCDLLIEIREIFEAQVGISTVGGILASQGEDLDEWQHRVVEPNLARLRSFFARGVEGGQLRSEVDYEQLIEMITGGIFVSDALRDDVPEDWAPNLVALIWPTISR